MRGNFSGFWYLKVFYSQLKLVWQTFTFIDFAEITKFSKFMPYIESLKTYPLVEVPI